ncbi:MAG: cyclase family protein [Verrucomicrobiales bacterium]|nr:cyclase family protein [Verrucomicrobiales bacterium]
MCLPACRSYLARILGGSLTAPPAFGVVDPQPGGSGPVPAQSWFPKPVSRMVDLTHPLDPDFPTYSGKPQLRYHALSTFDPDGWNFGEWQIHEHTGTHIDAPFHRCAGIAVDAVPPETLVGPLVILDIRAKAERNPDAEVTRDDLLRWEQRHGLVPDGAIVAMNSGWSAHARTPRFRGADDRGILHFPGFAADTVEFLLATRNVKGIAVDTLSLDHGTSTDFPAHTLWLGRGRWGLECVANLDQLPPAGATLVVGAPKLAGASGGPSRVFAFL